MEAGVDARDEPEHGAVLLASYQPPQDPTPATQQMTKDVDAIKSGAQLTSGTVAAYLSADGPHLNDSVAVTLPPQFRH